MTSIIFPTPVISTLSSISLERYVAAIFQAHNYFVKRDIWWSESLVNNPTHSVDILQADILAYFFSPFSESSILIECKGGGTFTDYFKFAGIVNHVKPDSAFFICNNSSNFDEIHNLGQPQDIKVLRPSDIITTFTSSGSEKKILYWYWSNEVQDCLLIKENLFATLHITSFSDEQKEAYGEIRKYNTLISSKTWTESDPRLQANLITDHFIDNKGFVGVIRKIQEFPRCDSENAIAQYILCESAASVVLKTKLEYIITAVRCAIEAFVSTDPNYLDEIVDEAFKKVVQKMIDSILIACRLPQFLQFWIYQFGGLLNTNNNEVSILAKIINEREETIYEFIKFLEEIFSILISTGNINWAIHNRSGILEFRNTPDSIRGYGIFFREEHEIDVTPFVYKAQWIKRLKDITSY